MSDTDRAREEAGATWAAEHQRPGADAGRRGDAEAQPVPYTLTPRAEALLNGIGPGARRQPARGWVLTPKAEALVAGQAEAEAAP